MLRTPLALLAIVVCGWFALGAVQARDVNRATALLSRGSRIDPATAAHVRSLLDEAAVLNPDREVAMLRAQAAAELGDHAQAERILNGVVSAEPQNALAWGLVARFATTGATLRRAYARIEALIPTVRSSQ